MSETTPLHRLVHCGRDAIADAAREVGQILAASRRNNPRDGVTGALPHGGGCFVRAQESPLVAGDQTFERTRCASRHADVIVSETKQVDTRLFGVRAMARGGAFGPRAVDRLGLNGAPPDPARSRPRR